MILSAGLTPAWQQILEFDLFLDVDQDGTPDFLDFNMNYAAFSTGGQVQNDEWIVIRKDLSDNSLGLGSPYPIISDFNAGVMSWRLSATWHGLDGGDTDFNFGVLCASIGSNGLSIDATGLYSFDYDRSPYDWWKTGDPGPADRTSTVTVVGDGAGTQGFIVVDLSGEPGQGQGGAGRGAEGGRSRGYGVLRGAGGGSRRQ